MSFLFLAIGETESCFDSAFKLLEAAIALDKCNDIKGAITKYIEAIHALVLER